MHSLKTLFVLAILLFSHVSQSSELCKKYQSANNDNWLEMYCSQKLHSEKISLIKRKINEELAFQSTWRMEKAPERAKFEEFVSAHRAIEGDFESMSQHCGKAEKVFNLWTGRPKTNGCYFPFTESLLDYYETIIQLWYPLAKPSFNCDYAKSDVEKHICSSEALSEKDKSLSSLYADTRRLDESDETIIASQKKWLTEERNPCDSVECLMEEYSSRISELKSTITALKTQRVVKNIYLEEGADNKVCEDVLSSLEKNDVSHILSAIRLNKDKDFNPERISKGHIKLSSKFVSEKKEKVDLLAYDINNDGAVEYMLEGFTWMGGTPSGYTKVLSDKVAELNEIKFTYDEFHGMAGVVSRPTWPYSKYGIWNMSMFPWKYDNVVYLVMQDQRFDSSNPDSSLLISKYTGTPLLYGENGTDYTDDIEVVCQFKYIK